MIYERNKCIGTKQGFTIYDAPKNWFKRWNLRGLGQIELGSQAR